MYYKKTHPSHLASILARIFKSSIILFTQQQTKNPRIYFVNKNDEEKKTEMRKRNDNQFYIGVYVVFCTAT